MSKKAGIIESHQGVMPTIADDVYLAPGSVVVGDVHIGAQSSVWYNSVVRGDVCPIRIGERTNIQDNSTIHVTYQTGPTTIGDDVIIGHGVLMHACTIGNACLVGIGSIILDDCEMEPGSMLAAGALLTPNKRIPSGELWGGSPAKKLRDLTEKDLAFIQWDANHYVELAAEYAAKS